MNHNTEIVEHAHGIKMPSVASLIRQHTRTDGEASHSVLHFLDGQFQMPLEGTANPALIADLESVGIELRRGERAITLSMVPFQSLHSDAGLELFESDGVELPDFDAIFSAIISSLKQSHDLKGNYEISIGVVGWKKTLSICARWLDEPKRENLDFYVSNSTFHMGFLDVLDVTQEKIVNRWYTGMFSGNISTRAVF
jgi:hypothetical protein